jgi:hypothetical protein
MANKGMKHTKMPRELALHRNTLSIGHAQEHRRADERVHEHEHLAEEFDDKRCVHNFLSGTNTLAGKEQ